MKVVFLEKQSFPNENFNEIKDLSSTITFQEFYYNKETSVEKILNTLNGVDIIIVGKIKLSKTLLEKLKTLKLICVTATGYNNIDTNYCKANNIQVANIVNYSTICVVEHIMGMILNLSHKILAYHRSIERGRWEESKDFTYFDYSVEELYGKHLGIIGRGNIGKKLAEVAKVFSMEVSFLERKNCKLGEERKEYISFTEGLKSCDIISVNCPLTEATKDLITMKEIKQMKRNSVLINCSRGGIINEEDCKEALKSGIIGGAGFDVSCVEPPRSDTFVLKELMDLPNFILTPHVAWAGKASIKELKKQLLNNIATFLEKGEAVNKVI